MSNLYDRAFNVLKKTIYIKGKNSGSSSSENNLLYYN